MTDDRAHAEHTAFVIETEHDVGYERLGDRQPPATGFLAILSLPCPGRRIRGGVGGQAMTPCGFCGEVMASTAGPHSADGRYAKPVVIEWVNDGLIGWRPFMLHLTREG